MVESEKIPDSFLCCICLDLLFKPIVLACGHVSCFWCVHKSMSGRRESCCPICRHPYNHFPTVSQMLHALLFNIYPIAYKRREELILAEEKQMGYFSPQFDYTACQSPENQEYDHLKDHEHLSTTSLESDSCSETCSTREGEPKGKSKRLSITDVLCAACKQLVFRPVFLNCGQGYCESCISCSVDENGMLRCQVCHSLHPTGFPKVCLELDHFLEDQFPRDYAMRRDAVELKQANIKIENPISSGKKGFSFSSMPKEELSHLKLHFGVGCDFCGIYPIIGDRYRCKDCVEKIGFDLCGDCYNTRSKRPGRFNQQHTPEHKFEHVDSINGRRVIRRLMNDQFGNTSPVLANPGDLSDVPENEFPSSLISVGADEGTRNTAMATVIHTGSADDQNESQSTG
ncbi:conserved hypothetical protein [Ricinus communis]|uniref:Uncharacterized protein n=1 Tax=Ricinus communis TaxID=3988 RepID=B9S532_RICCO|nr:conserved hypothetical protein [Ricinus communis]